MEFKIHYILFHLIVSSIFSSSLESEIQSGQISESTLQIEDYCITEPFQPQCLKNEAILMTSATYGRMRIGRCITAEEVAEFGTAFEGDPRYFGCSADVLSILDRKCSGRSACEVRLLDISSELDTQPCFSSLKAYLEASHECIRVADEERSCSLTVSSVPSHILHSSESKRKCATAAQPWMVEAPAGQKIKITLIDFLSSQISQDEKEDKEGSCLGVIIDKAAKRNVSICVGGDKRTRYLYSSKADTLEIYYNTQEQKQISNNFVKFALSLEAVGCSDLIAPEDAWLKRNDDSIVIGCYSNRLSWELHCDGERWIGVFGNCSQAHFEAPHEQTKLSKSGWSDDQILTVVCVSGVTLTICLAVLCTGIVCLRRFSTKTMKTEDSKALGFNSSIDKQQLESLHSTVLTPMVNAVNDDCCSRRQAAPDYAVFVGDGEYKEDQDD